MALVLVSGPSIEPVSVDEVKAQLRLDGDEENLLLAGLVSTARVHLETMTERAFITQQWTLLLDEWPLGSVLELPLAPVQSISSVAVFDIDDQPLVIDPPDYRLDAASDPPRFIWRGPAPRPDPERPENGISITFTAGYGERPADLPQPLRQAMLLLVAHWYEHREPLSPAGGLAELPQMVRALTTPYRRTRL